MRMDLARFCSSARVMIVAGKGGVGKTTVTATLATAAADAGLSVLIVEVEGKSGLAACFGRPPLGYEEAELAPRVRGRTLTPDEALVDYLENHGLRRISKRLVRSGALEVVSSAVPGMKDILVLGKVKALEQERAADLIIIDAPAAGHAVTFLMSPRGLGDAVRVGPVSKQSTDVVGAAEFRRERYVLQHEQADRLAARLPLPQVRLPFLFTAELGPPEIDALAVTFEAQVEELPESSSGRVTVS